MDNLFIKKLKVAIYSLLVSTGMLNLLTRITSKIFRVVALGGHGSKICLQNGFLPVPVHFYSPIPDINDLEKRKIWDVRSELKGVNFRVDEQLELLKKLGSSFSEECQWPLQPKDNLSEFYLQNQSFSYGCAASTHCVIRHFKPRTIIEIGSGMSSRVISKAIQLNGFKDGHYSNYIIVDPYPAEFIKSKSIEMKEFIESRVELMDTAFFEQLKENDVLFIDSGHCVRIGGDVNYLFLEVLPRLAPGVIVHIHDIGIPYEYSKTYATSESFRQFWTEQYLLQSFLCFNSEFEVLLAMYYLMTDHRELFQKVFPHYNPDHYPFISSSFWIRRKLQDQG
jgi:hypothetical protein